MVQRSATPLVEQSIVDDSVRGGRDGGVGRASSAERGRDDFATRSCEMQWWNDFPTPGREMQPCRVLARLSVGISVSSVTAPPL